MGGFEEVWRFKKKHAREQLEGEPEDEKALEA
jgi:hypothetical protein